MRGCKRKAELTETIGTFPFRADPDETLLWSGTVDADRRTAHIEEESSSRKIGLAISLVFTCLFAFGIVVTTALDGPTIDAPRWVTTALYVLLTLVAASFSWFIFRALKGFDEWVDDAAYVITDKRIIALNATGLTLRTFELHPDIIVGRSDYLLTCTDPDDIDFEGGLSIPYAGDFDGAYKILQGLALAGVLKVWTKAEIAQRAHIHPSGESVIWEELISKQAEKKSKRKQRYIVLAVILPIFAFMLYRSGSNLLKIVTWGAFFDHYGTFVLALAGSLFSIFIILQHTKSYRISDGTPHKSLVASKSKLFVLNDREEVFQSIDIADIHRVKVRTHDDIANTVIVRSKRDPDINPTLTMPYLENPKAVAANIEALRLNAK